jgi:hypothetical protein
MENTMTGWLTSHFILGVLTWMCLALGALVLLLLTAYTTIRLAMTGWARARQSWQRATTTRTAPAGKPGGPRTWWQQAHAEAIARQHPTGAIFTTIDGTPLPAEEQAKIQAILHAVDEEPGR